MNIQDTRWEIDKVYDISCGLNPQEILTFGAEGSQIAVLKKGNTIPEPSSWVVTGYSNGSQTALVMHNNKAYDVTVVDENLLTCKPHSSNTPPDPIVNPWSPGGLENGGVKLLPWMVSVAGGILAGGILGISLGIPLAATLAIAIVSAVSAALIYKIVNPAGDPGASWTAQAGGTGQPPGGPPPYGPRIPREADTSRPA